MENTLFFNYESHFKSLLERLHRNKEVDIIEFQQIIFNIEMELELLAIKLEQYYGFSKITDYNINAYSLNFELSMLCAKIRNFVHIYFGKDDFMKQYALNEYSNNYLLLNTAQ